MKQEIKTKTILLTALILLFTIAATAQQLKVTGKVIDQTDNSPITGATVILSLQSDSLKKTGTATDLDGNFIINAAQGAYRLKISYIGYSNKEQIVNMLGTDVNLGTIKIKAAGNVLKNVVVKGQQVRAQQNGDTTAFNANAYKTNPDASAEDLVNKMPGVTSDNNGIKVNGETVQQVLVDGKPFFGDDPSVALKNLPAEVIDKIQVFDKLSDQAQFTGFDDGQSQKAINIITKRGKNNGQFGKVYAGYGTDDRYTAGGNLNIFEGDRRISIIGLSNNINQQNFSAEDLLGVNSTSSGGSGRGGYGGGGGRGGGGGGNFGGGGPGGGGSNASNFMVGQQNGITKTNSIGLNYSDNWGKKIKVTGSYFFNQTDNTNETVLTRNYFSRNDSGLIYNEASNTETQNWNHRVNFRLEYNIDSFNSLIVTPKLSFQKNDYVSNLLGTSTLGDAFAGLTRNKNTTNYNGYNFNNNLLFRHRFAKRGRTLSVNINTATNEKSGDGTLYALNKFTADSTLLDQNYNLYSNGYTLSAGVNYTEPISRKGQLQFSYNPSLTKSKSDKETYNFNSSEQSYVDLDTLLSNKYDNTYTTQRGGLSYRYNDRKLNYMLGANYQYATLSGQQFFPSDFDLRKTFSTVLPQAMFNYRFDQGSNIRIMYRTNTVAPTITQLQNVVDISNPLLLRTGNPNLTQDFEHNLTLRYGKAKPSGGNNLFVFANATYINNYIGNQTLIPTKDSAISPQIVINKGSQLTRPVNLDGYWNARAFLTYGMPVGFIKSNLNLNGGFTYGRTPSIINQITNLSNSYATNGGFVLSSNISEDLDFTLSYNGSYNVVKNSIQSQSDNSYYSHTASAKINYIMFKRLVFNTNLSQYYYSGFVQGGSDQQYLLWNAYVAYKFLKNRALEARISAYDLLNQNKSIARNITDTYIEDSRTQVLTQYFMFTLTYTLRNFKGSTPSMPSEPRGFMPGPPPPGGGYWGH